jgi:hypothetical protein
VRSRPTEGGGAELQKEGGKAAQFTGLWGHREEDIDRYSMVMEATETRLVATPRTTTPVQPLARVGHIAVPARLVRLALVNAIIASALLIALLPSPWGGLVPVVALVQIVWWRLGAAVAVSATLGAAATGAMLAGVLGIHDERRAAMALLAVVLSMLAAWPSRSGSAGR